MTSPKATSPTQGAAPDRIDVSSEAAVGEWTKKLDVTGMQLKDAVTAVGDRATDVELYLKGSRSSTNTDRVEEAGGQPK